jgi:S1-C subfamily serine protease
VSFAALLCGQAAAQTPAPVPNPSPAPSPRSYKRVEAIRRQKIDRAASLNRIIVENKLAAPQVVTILHSLNGLKVFRLLLRSPEQVEAIANLDQAFTIAGEVHTNVIAGLALDDGHTIAAWLPEAAAEMPPPRRLFAPRAPTPPGVSAPATPPAQGAAPVNPVTPIASGPGMTGVPNVPAISYQAGFIEPADLRIITRDGKRMSGRYIGLDGLTGLSLITLGSGALPETPDTKVETIAVGQRLRVIGPQPAPRVETGPRNAMYVRIGETDAVVVKVNRSPSGEVARVKIRSAKFSPANIGGIAINDAGETLGIVNAVEGTEATIVPLALVRSAAKRVIARQASVPRPWLGIRGEPIGAASLDQIVRYSWKLERARALTEKREGILLTSVAPGSPAARAKLKPGDVILSVNNGFVRNAEDFTWLLDDAGPGSPMTFKVARPGQEDAEALEIELSESPDPWFGLKSFGEYLRTPLPPGSLMAQGIETIALKPKVAMRFGSSGGLLVVYVQPSTEASKAGLRTGDVIESIDGQPITSGSLMTLLQKDPDEVSTCVVVRNRERIVLKFKYSTNEYTAPPKP